MPAAAAACCSSKPPIILVSTLYISQTSNHSGLHVLLAGAGEEGCSHNACTHTLPSPKLVRNYPLAALRHRVLIEHSISHHNRAPEISSSFRFSIFQWVTLCGTETLSISEKGSLSLLEPCPLQVPVSW
eukprot:1140045-Pelagomonas_calceolata.AAC.8